MAHEASEMAAREAANAAESNRLSRGNPRIAKGKSDASVQPYMAAMSGSKRDAGRRPDALIERTVPGARNAVRWNPSQPMGPRTPASGQYRV